MLVYVLDIRNGVVRRDLLFMHELIMKGSAIEDRHAAIALELGMGLRFYPNSYSTPPHKSTLNLHIDMISYPLVGTVGTPGRLWVNAAVVQKHACGSLINMGNACWVHPVIAPVGHISILYRVSSLVHML